MKYHHDRLHPREPKPTPLVGGALGEAGSTVLPTALPEFLDGDGPPQDFEQARCTPRGAAPQGAQPRTDA